MVANAGNTATVFCPIFLVDAILNCVVLREKHCEHVDSFYFYVCWKLIVNILKSWCSFNINYFLK